MIKTSNPRTVLLLAVFVLCWGLFPATIAMAAEDGGAVNTNPLSFDPDLALFTALVFVCLLLVLWKFAWGPIMSGLAAREEGIAANIDQAKQDAEAAAEKKIAEEKAKAAAAAEAKKSLLIELPTR